MDTRELTYGEKAVGVTFNVGGNPDVDLLKKLYAEIIDSLYQKMLEIEGIPEKAQVRIILQKAIVDAMTAQMWAVKGVTYPF